MTPEEVTGTPAIEGQSQPAPTPDERARAAAQELSSFMGFLHQRYGVDFNVDIKVVPLALTAPPATPQAEPPAEEEPAL